LKSELQSNHVMNVGRTAEPICCPSEADLTPSVHPLIHLVLTALCWLYSCHARASPSSPACLYSNVTFSVTLFYLSCLALQLSSSCKKGRVLLLCPMPGTAAGTAINICRRMYKSQVNFSLLFIYIWTEQLFYLRQVTS
jgi:hypothetical protein